MAPAPPHARRIGRHENRGLPPLAAIAEAAALHVEVRVMGGVIVRPEEGTEIAAAPLLQCSQEGPVARIAPAFFHRDMPTVGEAETGDVEGIRTCMAAERR